MRHGLSRLRSTSTARPVWRSRPTMWADSSKATPFGMSLVVTAVTSSCRLFPAAGTWFPALVRTGAGERERTRHGGVRRSRDRRVARDAWGVWYHLRPARVDAAAVPGPPGRPGRGRGPAGRGVPDRFRAAVLFRAGPGLGPALAVRQD